MRFLIDTSVWSEALRRKKVSIHSGETTLSRLIAAESEIIVIGIVLQEILSGIKDKKLFTEIQSILSDFPYIETERQDYIFAAELRNSLKAKGIHAGSFDFLIASMAIRHDLLLVTTDKDFQHIAAYSKLRILYINTPDTQHI
ncbi:MAG TPA: PIN domain-containing protein [Bacteroidota bacterium]|nr:PIN domain-containing protein [Bacteroidota bacterium]